ncbi:hypothetical protein AK88_04805 [Plasmodium fragile]|uniref:Uncharacterized protein n=1 Tax=Plasmodium fragile TaxID=5857 RepID=A0A0D9QEW1_PLAFR|nr:uncharacterized protein AK88_04805 [Plasmodium fragile]KJP85539.1 hypothetical protein AK88_04805 [Plasmodium fragile]
MRTSRVLKGETNVQTLLQQHNTMFEEKFMGSVDSAGDTCLQDRSDVTKHCDSSNSRSRKSSPRDSSRTHSNSTMHRGNVDKSNESLNLNNFDDDNGERTVDRSTNFGSMDSIFERPSDDRDDVDQAVSASAHVGSMDSLFGERAHDDLEDKDRMAEASEYHNKDKKYSTRAGVNVDDEVHYYIDKLQQQNKFSGSPSGGVFNNTMLGKFFRKIFPTVGSEMRRHMNMQTKENRNYSDGKVKGIGKWFNLARDRRPFALLGVFGVFFFLFLTFLIKMNFFGLTSLLYALFLPPFTVPIFLLVPLAISYALPFIAMAALCGGYSFLLFYYVFKLYKGRRPEEYIDESITNGDIKSLKAMKNIAADNTNSECRIRRP